MRFEHPAVLYALLALIVPVLVHLFSFRRYQQVLFSNVQFLKEIKEKQASRAHLKERLILAARLSSLFFIILAFARPYVTDNKNALSNTTQAVSVFVDNSYSMQTLNREGSLLDEAKRRAKEVIATYRPNDRFQLLTQDFEGRQQRLLTADEFNNAVDTIKLSAQSHTLQQIVNRQEALLSLQPQAVKSSYIISDFQKNLTSGKKLKAEGMQLCFVRLKAAELPNITIDSVFLLNAVHRAGATEKLVVQLHNYAGKDARAVPVKLIINGVQKALGSSDIKANTVQADTLAFSGLPTGWQQAELQLQDNPVIFDNRFFFTFKVDKQLPVLLINGEIPDKYLTAAFSTDPFFKLDQESVSEINYSAFNRYPLLILSNLKSVSTGLAQQLKTYVSNGGSLLVFPADGADLTSYRNLLQPLNAAWPAKLTNEPARVTTLNLHQPVFSGIFEQMPQNPDLPLVKKYYQFTDPSNNPANNMMQLAGHNLFLAAYSSGKGKVYLSAVPLNEDYSNLPRHALLLPMLFRMALLGRHDAPLYNTIGNNERIYIPPVNLAENQLLQMRKDKQSFIPDIQRHDGNASLYVADQVKQAGLYQLTKADSLMAVIAFDNSRSESDLKYLTDAELLNSAPKTSTLFEAENRPLKPMLAGANNSLQLWKVCLILALILIAAETVLIRYFKTTVVS